MEKLKRKFDHFALIENKVLELLHPLKVRYLNVETNHDLWWPVTNREFILDCVETLGAFLYI
jgi:hypothetical protein